jgi:hypothetical protein
MIEIKHNLNKISKWLKKNQPNAYPALQAGLSKSEVDYFFESPRFLLPDEFYDLYRWHNGMSSLDVSMEYSMNPYQLFPGYTFNSIQDAIDIRSSLLDIMGNILLDKMRDEDGFWIEHSGILNNYLFPIFTLDFKDHICILGKEDNSEDSPLLRFFIEGDIYLIYDDLNSMMQTIASCYEVGAYYNFEYPDGYKELRCDERLAEEIRIQYNPKSALL